MCLASTSPRCAGHPPSSSTAGGVTSGSLACAARRRAPRGCPDETGADRSPRRSEATPASGARGRPVHLVDVHLPRVIRSPPLRWREHVGLKVSSGPLGCSCHATHELEPASTTGTPPGLWPGPGDNSPRAPPSPARNAPRDRLPRRPHLNANRRGLEGPIRRTTLIVEVAEEIDDGGCGFAGLLIGHAMHGNDRDPTRGGLVCRRHLDVL